MLRTACFVLTLPLAAQGWVDRTSSTGPSPRHNHAMCFDDVHGYVIMYGGGDTWTWNGTAWTSRGTQNLYTPSSPWDHPNTAMAFHPPTGLPVLVIGAGTWTWDGSSWVSRAQLPPINGNCDLAVGFDPVRGQLVLFVGCNNTGWPPAGANDTLLWDGFGWTLRQPAVRPYPGFYPHMCFDSAAGKLLLVTSDLNHTQSFCWEWNGSTWNQRMYASAPTCSGAMVLDTAHHVAVMFDGSLDPQPGHTWTFANGTSQRLGSPVEPSHRVCSAAAFDPLRNRFVLFGGTNAYAPPSYYEPHLGDTWEFDLGAGATYSTFGTGCAGSRGVPVIAAQGASLPRIGQTFELHVGNLPFTGPAFLFLGLSNTSYGPTPLPFSLAGLGAPGCSVLASGDELNLLTNVLGTAVWQRSMPNLPGLTFYNQAFALDLAANALGFTVSNGGQATIGF